MSKRWTQRPEGSTWGDWGDDDELGRINLVTPEKVLQGVAEVEAGISFCLSLPLDFPGGTALNQRRHPPKLAPTEDMDGNPGTFFNTHRMLGQYYSNAYFPQISPEEAVPIDADLQAAAAKASAARQSTKSSLATEINAPAPATGETAPPLEETTHA